VSALPPEQRDPLLNEFALRSLRDVADGDYIAARMAYRAELILQALWASQQALEKYIKAILLLRRIPRKKPTHLLQSLLGDLETHFTLRLSTAVREFITVIDSWGVDRYFTFPYGTEGLELIQLDHAVWVIRRYCIPYGPRLSPGGTPLELLDIRHIEDAVNYPPQQYHSISTGFLDNVLSNRRNVARPALVWNNLYFGANARKTLKNLKRTFSSTNSPLALYPEIIDEVRKYVYLPSEADTLKGP
jgi:HEPN domain-containing protein